MNGNGKNSFIQKQKYILFKKNITTPDYLEKTFSKNPYRAICQLHKSG